MCVAVLVLTGAQSSAATISNRDDKEQKITILIEGEASTDHALKPQQILEKICLKGCVVRLNDNEDDEYQLEAEDAVSIEDGYLYHDTADAPAATTPPAAPPPAPGTAQPPVKQ